MPCTNINTHLGSLCILETCFPSLLLQFLFLELMQAETAAAVLLQPSKWRTELPAARCSSVH